MVCCQSSIVKREVNFIKYSVGAVPELRKDLPAALGIVNEAKLINDVALLL